MIVKRMGLRRTNGQPKFGELNWERPTYEDYILGKDEEDPETLSCPFCGSEFTQVRWIGHFLNDNTGYACGFTPGFRGECTDCWATTRACRTKEEAAYWWNIRSS